jgi:hypothetical protein
MDLWAWKRFCEETGIDPYLSIRPLTAEIKLKRDGIYLPFSCEIKQAPKSYETNGATIQINARGTLSKLEHALITKTYEADDACDIARDMITVRQAKTYGDFGITNGNVFQIGTPTDRTYTRYSIMDAIRNLSDDVSGGFDFFFDHDWSFWTMATRGSEKSDVIYRFGGDDSNVIDYENPEDGTVIANDVTIVGEGIGDPLTGTDTDATSALTYGLREIALIHSNIDNETWLTDKAAAEVRDRKDMYDLPNIIVGSDVFDLGDKWVGDTIPLICTDEASPYTGSGRIKELRVDVDDNHHEIISVECLKV